MPIFGLRLRAMEPTSYFRAPEGCQKGDFALVESETGVTLARLESGPMEALPGISERDLPQILRPANAEDMDIYAKNQELGRQAKIFCRECIQNRQLDMKLVDVEVFFDRSKLIFYFTAPNRVDFRELVKDLVREYRARIELRQIGVRHETQMLGAIGNCGRVCCCRGYLRRFAPVTIKMAKEQNLFLNPAKISGICGRLLCCLSYEQEGYEKFHHEAPRPGKKYHTDKGQIRVLRVNMFKNTVTVLSPDNEEREMSLEEWQGLRPGRAGGEPVAQEEEREEEWKHLADE